MASFLDFIQRCRRTLVRKASVCRFLCFNPFFYVAPFILLWILKYASSNQYFCSIFLGHISCFLLRFASRSLLDVCTQVIKKGIQQTQIHNWRLLCLSSRSFHLNFLSSQTVYKFYSPHRLDLNLSNCMLLHRNYSRCRSFRCCLISFIGDPVCQFQFFFCAFRRGSPMQRSNYFSYLYRFSRLLWRWWIK